jgi:chemotaxis response regulator CheB
MRAAEFLRSLADMIDALDKPSTEQSHDSKELDQNPVFVPPLQQHLELDKAEQGKDSPIIQKLTRSEH